MRSDEPKLSRGEARIAKIQQQRLASKTVAKSAAHVGVVARPMDKNLSKILDMKRAAMRAGGTSVKRLGERPTEEVTMGATVSPESGSEEREALMEANSEKTAMQRATSAARLRTAEGEMGLKKAAPLPEPPDMAI